MKEKIVHVEQTLPLIIGLLCRKISGQKMTPASLSSYSYTQIARICDQALAPSRISGVLSRDGQVNSIYHKLNQEGSPAPITAAVVLGLARAGNLEALEVDILRDITYALPVINQKHRPFCAAIERSVQSTSVMDRSSRPDYASSQQLAEIAKGSYDALLKHKEKQTKFAPYTTLGGERISSRGKFVSSLRGDDDIAGACVRIAVDLGVLTTQPEKMPLEEGEWLRRNVHYVEMVDNPRLSMALENFHNLLGVVK